MDKIDELLTRGVEKIYPSPEALERALRGDKKLKLYQGFDPSMPSLHLGNFVGLMKLRQFQKLGHEVIFLVGDFTGMIGDPTDKLATRKQLTREEVLANATSWKEQAGKVLDFEGKNPARMLFNSEWNDKVSFKELIEIASNFTWQQLIERDMFQTRIKEGQPIHFHELLYPIAQGYDSVAMNVDLEIGGSDQVFNMLVGRTLMKAMKGKEKFVLGTKLLLDKEGKKAGKTTGNALFLDATPEDFYAGIMSFTDELLPLSFELLTDIALTGLEEKITKDPMGEKKRLAHEVVKLLWGEGNARCAQESFENTFQEGKIPENIEEVALHSDKVALLDALFDAKLVSSRSEAKRLIKDAAVDVDGKTVTDPQSEIDLTHGVVVKIGKKKFARIRTR